MLVQTGLLCARGACGEVKTSSSRGVDRLRLSNEKLFLVGTVHSYSW